MIPAALTATRTSPGADLRVRPLLDLEDLGTAVLGDDDRAHRATDPRGLIARPLKKSSRPAIASIDVVGHRRVGGQRHDGLRRGVLGADRGGDDVDAVLAEGGADAADHPGLVGVAEDREVLGERQVEALAPDADQVGVVARPDAGAGDLDRLAAGLDPDA